MAITVTQGAEILNQTMSELGYPYQIDTTSNETIEAGYKVIGAYPPSMLNNILNMGMKILNTRVYTAMFSESKNPMRRFWKNAVDYGGGIQEIYLKLVESEDGYWSSDFSEDNNWGGFGSEEALATAIANDLVSYKKDDTINKIHVVTDKFRIKMSISDLEYTKVFTPNGFADFVNSKYANMQQSAEAKLMQIGIKVAQKMIAENHVVYKTGYNLNNTNGVTTIVEAIKSTSRGMEGLTNLYNYDGVYRADNPDDIYLMLTPEFLARLETRGYANAFNLQYYRDNNRLIVLPAGTELGVGPNGREIGAVLLDYRAITLAVRYWETMPFIVSNTDYRNTYLKVQLITGYTEFFNAVAFETGEVGNFSEGNSYIITNFGHNYNMRFSFTIDGVNAYELPFETLSTNNSGVTLLTSYLWTVPTGSKIVYTKTGATEEELFKLSYAPANSNPVLIADTGDTVTGTFIIDGTLIITKSYVDP